MRYQAITSAMDKEGNLTFDGKTCGIKFEAGEAMFDDLTIKKRSLGLSAEEIATSMERDFGYKVIRMHDDGTPLTNQELTQLLADKRKLSAEAVTAPLLSDRGHEQGVPDPEAA